MDSNQIDITGCDLTLLVKKVYELSRPQGMGFLHFNPAPMTDEKAAQLIRPDSRWPVQMDYVSGRACKFNVAREDDGRLLISNRWYDHSEADLRALLKAIGKELPAKEAATEPVAS